MPTGIAIQLDNLCNSLWLFSNYERAQLEATKCIRILQFWLYFCGIGKFDFQ